jgi:predicted outer membrane repeat protein
MSNRRWSLFGAFVITLSMAATARAADPQSCAPGQTDWWCCPQGSLHFSVNPDGDAQQDADTAASTCFPSGFGLSSTCTLRGVVARANQLRGVPGTRPQCAVVAELAPGTHVLAQSAVTFSAGELTLLGMGARQGDVVVQGTPAQTHGLLVEQPSAGSTTALTVRNLLMKDGRSGSGGAIAVIGPAAVSADSPRAASLVIQDVTFENNQSNQPGGAVAVESATLEVHDSLFRNNVVDNFEADGGQTSRGGGLYVSNSEAIVDHSAFVGNAASKGGGVGAYSTFPFNRGKIAITNSTLSRNFCGQSGCGFDSFDVDVTLAYDTIVDNQMASVPTGPVGPRQGPGLNIAQSVPSLSKRINVFGSIIARNKKDFMASTDPSDGQSWDCSVMVDPGLTIVGASNNFIGSGGQDCILLGAPAGDPLIGEGRPAGGSNPDDPVLDPGLAKLPESPLSCPSSPSFRCQQVCPTASSAAVCAMGMPPDAPVVNKGVAVTCPSDDQQRYSRQAGTACTLGALEYYGTPNAPAQAQLAVLPRGGFNATSSTSNPGEGPASAVDGSAATRFSTGSPQTPGQWFSLDMQTPKAFSQVTLDPGAAFPNDYARQYQVFVSNDAVTWLGPVASGTGAPGVQTIAFPTQTARFVGVVQTGTSTSWWSVTEFNVYGPGGVPVAPLSSAGWTASASGTNGSEVPSRALDGNTATRWSTGVPQASGQSFQLDLRQPRTIARLALNSDSSSPNDYPRAFNVYATNDLASWGAPIASGTGTSALVSVAFAQVTARYLKVELTGSTSYWWSIAEATVYGLGSFAPVATALPRTGWTATASPTCSSPDTADRALDDQAGTRFSSCQSQASGHSFQVDMLTARTFSKITLDAGTSVGDYPRSYDVYVTNNPAAWGSPVASGTGSGQLVSITFPDQTARYLKVVLTGGAAKWWSIHELDVYGVAPAVLPRQGWTASASLSSATAAAGIDTNLSTRWTSGVPQANGQYFQVDMAVARSFNQITLSSESASSDYPRGYQVFASNNPSSFGPAIASGAASSSLVSIGFPTQTARYLRIVQTGASSNWWSISELNVWSPGF